MMMVVYENAAKAAGIRHSILVSEVEVVVVWVVEKPGWRRSLEAVVRTPVVGLVAIKQVEAEPRTLTVGQRLTHNHRTPLVYAIVEENVCPIDLSTSFGIFLHGNLSRSKRGQKHSCSSLWLQSLEIEITSQFFIYFIFKSLLLDSGIFTITLNTYRIYMVG